LDSDSHHHTLDHSPSDNAQGCVTLGSLVVYGRYVCLSCRRRAHDVSLSHAQTTCPLSSTDGLFHGSPARLLYSHPLLSAVFGWLMRAHDNARLYLWRIHREFPFPRRQGSADRRSQLVIDKSLPSLPKRKTDSSTVIRTQDSGDAKARIFKLNAVSREPILVERYVFLRDQSE
jgi:hypothetical protein